MKTIYFSNNLKRFRELKGLTKEELGKRVGVSGAMVGYWESGKNEPRMGKVQLIADVLETDIDQLLFAEPPKQIELTIDSLTDGLSENRKRAIKAVMSLSEEDLELFIQLMERNTEK
ncbi:helix-turn-helix transcriptional regulator [Paenibacillus stellifer]|uniref:helix-turn-helix transcriptional regulator n=1 Tax=Paenibacillus stellifer TaxID=169760 RepID=UPI000570E21D|nr:helix-turn-helix domain-containing protein [Paenibacillus stellifer]